MTVRAARLLAFAMIVSVCGVFGCGPQEGEGSGSGSGGGGACGAPKKSG